MAKSERLVPTAVHVVRRRETYVITGSKSAHLAEGMGMAGPRRNGVVYSAYTDWEISWEHGDSADANGHRPSAPRVLVTITSTYPRWRPPSSADPEVVRSFQAYLAAAEAHEDGHAELAIEAACDVFAALSVLPPSESAPRMVEAAREAAEAVLKTARSRDTHYDAHTEKDIRELTLDQPLKRSTSQ